MNMSFLPERPTYNPKRHIQEEPDLKQLGELAKKVSYGGNAEHKRNPRAFGLVLPPSMLRSDKTIREDAGEFTREKALRLLRKGISKGLVSKQLRDGLILLRLRR